MEFTCCAQCGLEIEGKGIQFRGRTFCSDECCEEFEADFVDNDEPDPADLADDDLDEMELEEDGLGFREEDDSSPKDEDDDDFAIEPDDF